MQNGIYSWWQTARSGIVRIFLISSHLALYAVAFLGKTSKPRSNDLEKCDALQNVYQSIDGAHIICKFNKSLWVGFISYTQKTREKICNPQKNPIVRLKPFHLIQKMTFIAFRKVNVFSRRSIFFEATFSEVFNVKTELTLWSTLLAIVITVFVCGWCCNTRNVSKQMVIN